MHTEKIKELFKDIHPYYLYIGILFVLCGTIIINRVSYRGKKTLIEIVTNNDARLTKVETNTDLLVMWKREEMKNDSLTKIILNHLPIAKPISNKDLIGVSSEFGLRKKPGSDSDEFHTGTDYRAKAGTPVLAAGAGIVKMSRYNGNYGYMIAIDHSVNISDYTPIKAETWYAHLSVMKVKVNQLVQQGDTIGTVGSTGNTTGPHLHYELWSDKRINPNLFF